MFGTKQSGIAHIVGLIIITAIFVIVILISHYSEQIGFIRQEEFTSQQRISELEARIRVLETRALQEKIHEPLTIQP